MTPVSDSFAFICLLASLIPYTTAAFSWTTFPSCAQPILQYYAPGTCDLGLTGNDFNRTYNCLCSNREWIDSSATGIYIVCGCDDLSLTADQLTRTCNSTNNPAISSRDNFIAIGNGGLTSCVPSPFSIPCDDGRTSQNCSSSSDNSASTASNASQQQKDCPRTDFILGLAIGVPSALFGGIAVFVTTLQLLVTHKKVPENASPWPVIRESVRSWCCFRPRRTRPAEPEASETSRVLTASAS